MCKSWEIEDYLDENLVFQNGFRDEPTCASLGAYGTVISFNNLKDAIEKATFSDEEWKDAIEYWDYNSYLSPTFKLLATWVKRIKNI